MLNRVIKDMSCILGLSVVICNAANAQNADNMNVESYVNDITSVMDKAEALNSWPNGFCRQTYQSIYDKSLQALKDIKNINGYDVLKNNLKELSQQSKAMLDLCEPFEEGAFPGGQLQTRYLRADMSLWKAQFDMLINKKPQPIESIAIRPSNNILKHDKLKDLDTFKDCNDFYCSEMVVLPKGNYIMGGSPGEHKELNVDDYRAAWESPQHKVNIRKRFSISKTEVTVGDFSQFIKETKRQIAEGCLAFPGYPAMNNPDYVMFNKKLSWKNPGFSQDKTSPVTCVTRKDAEDYAVWLSHKTGQKYRLPSEAEWEYAARAGTSTPYYWGKEIDDGCDFAAIYDQSTDKATGYKFVTAKCNDNTPYTARVGSFKPNKWGIFDITGNAREWVSDSWIDSYKTGPYTEKPRKEGISQFPVLRGGAWNYMPQNLRIAYRSSYYSWLMRSYMWGFRLVREI